jgi:hypothetical protein
MLLLDYLRAKTNVCVKRKMEVAIVGLESGLGVASLLLCSCVMGKLSKMWLRSRGWVKWEKR